MAKKIGRRKFLKNSLLAGGAALAALHRFEGEALSAEMAASRKTRGPRFYDFK